MLSRRLDFRQLVRPLQHLLLQIQIALRERTSSSQQCAAHGILSDGERINFTPGRRHLYRRFQLHSAQSLAFRRQLFQRPGKPRRHAPGNDKSKSQRAQRQHAEQHHLVRLSWHEILLGRKHP